ncbi:hypothetical protein FB451DRAFT_1286292 [Mycena latifolia]|nr:hypothetical protein FB451DRAFT_1286292 [Mycena latifolia]
MHRCWNVLEILGIIIEHLGQGPYTNGAISAFLLTCRAFLDPALDGLWHTQTDFLPLLKCFPVWIGHDEHPRRVFISSFKVSRVVVPQDWDRLLSYSRRIKKLIISPQSNGCFVKFMELVSMSLPVEFLLPNLQHISWNPRDEELLPHLRLFLSPKITSIALTLPGSMSCLSVLPWLASRYPSLPQLSVTFRDNPGVPAVDDQNCRHAATQMICALSEVRQLSLPCVEVSAYHHLAMMQNLRSLTIEVLDQMVFTDNFISTHLQPLFCDLSALDLPALTVEEGINFIRVLSNAPLQTVKLVMRKTAPEETAASLFSEINLHCSHSSLTSIDVNLGVLDRTHLLNTRIFVITSPTIRPLLAFTNLTRVSVTSPIGFCLDDDFVEAMALSWPNIESLALSRTYVTPGIYGHIEDPASKSPDSNASFFSLIFFARHCPHLRFLQIPFDAEYRFTASCDGAHPSPRAGLPLHDSIRAARFLSTIFPALASVGTAREIVHGTELFVTDDGTPAFLWHEHWKMVGRLVPAFAAVRAEEEGYWREELDPTTVNDNRTAS